MWSVGGPSALPPLEEQGRRGRRSAAYDGTAGVTILGRLTLDGLAARKVGGERVGMVARRLQASILMEQQYRYCSSERKGEAVPNLSNTSMDVSSENSKPVRSAARARSWQQLHFVSEGEECRLGNRRNDAQAGNTTYPNI
jgi:hypothetical protein